MKDIEKSEGETAIMEVTINRPGADVTWFKVSGKLILSVSDPPSVCLSVCLFVCQFFGCPLPVFNSLSLSHLFHTLQDGEKNYIFINMYLSIYLSIYLKIYLSTGWQEDRLFGSSLRAEAGQRWQSAADYQALHHG